MKPAIAVAIIVAWAAFWAFWVAPAYPHEWYEARCCSGRDCQPIDNLTVRITPQGYVVTLKPGDHPFVKATMTQTFRFPDTDQTNNYPIGPGGTREATYGQDENYHGCVTPGGSFLCLYLPITGS